MDYFLRKLVPLATEYQVLICDDNRIADDDGPRPDPRC
jgi:hypothetical protein